MECRAKIAEENGTYCYFDKDGNELHDGDIIVFENGREEKLFLAADGTLGMDATNPCWIASGKAVPCEYGVYPLTLHDLREMRLMPAPKKEEKECGF